MPTKANAKATGSKGSGKAANLKGPSTTGNSKLVNKTVGSQLQEDMPSDKLGSMAAQSKQSDISNQSEHSSNPSLIQNSTDNLIKENPVNRKKQKRRIKEAAKRAAEQQSFGAAKQTVSHKASGQVNGYEYPASDFEDEEQDEADEVGDLYYADETSQQDRATARGLAENQVNGHANFTKDEQSLAKESSKKRKPKKGALNPPDETPQSHDALSRTIPMTENDHSESVTSPRNGHPPSKDRIWNTSTAEERERIKQFWLSLGEDDRRSLVKVEKEAVLKKMKEQQKHSCSCTVCGRKRTAIEEELEVLYDAYYEELEQYANNQHLSIDDSTPMIPPRMYPHPISYNHPNRNRQSYGRRSSRAPVQEIQDEDDGFEEDEDSEAVEDDDLSDDYIDQEPEPTPAAADFFNFGRSLTVQGGILTVADDLLKNDGKKFIEMMEQLAERRMQREEDAQYAASGMSIQHNHPGALEDEMYEEEDDEEDYDSQEDEEFEEDEMDTMTEDQRMEEGRRMFQIFAARMFEQRVLTAYREKVALERQQRLIEELDDESRVDAQREAKRAKEAQKKKEKKRQQKQARDEEKARREAERAAEEASAKALEEKKAEEQRVKKEEQRKKREAERKAQEEERARKEAERQKRIQEAREQQAEQERKLREQKERDKRKKEEAKRKEREEREAKEREKEARQKKEREAIAKREQMAKITIANGPREQVKKDEMPAPKAMINPLHAFPKRPSPANTAGPSSSALQLPTTSSSHTSPHLPIATPIVPKAPTPVRPRQSSYQESRTTSPKSAQPVTSTAASPKVAGSHYGGAPSIPFSSGNQPTPPQPFQPQVRYSPKQASPSSITRPPGFANATPNPGSGFESSFGTSISELIGPFSPASHPLQSGPSSNLPHHAFAATGGTTYPSAHDSVAFPQPRGKMEAPPLQPTPIGRSSAAYGEIGHTGNPRENVATQNHSRNTSTSSNVAAQTQPIARPAPIQRPSSVTPQQQSGASIHNTGVEDLTDHLGSKALLGDDDDDDGPLAPTKEESLRSNMAVGGPRRAGFAGPPGLPDPIGHTRHENPARSMPPGVGSTWSAQPSPFGNPTSPWPSSSGFARTGINKGFGPIGAVPHLHTTTRAITVRTLIANACQKLPPRSPMGLSGWHRAEDIHRDVQLSRPQNMAPISLEELLELCDTVGNVQNGGGSFEVYRDQVGVHIRFLPGRSVPVGSIPGEIGSPIASGQSLFGGPPRPFQQPGGFPPSTGF